MAIPGDQFRKLQAGLLSAFPKYADLEQMVRMRLDVSLPEIVRQGDMKTVSYDLIAWAEAQGRLDDLIRGARADNPRNPELAAVAAELGGHGVASAAPRIPPYAIPATGPTPTDPQATVFISYSHKDEAWKDRLMTHLGVLQSQGLVQLWDDRRIGAGEDWYAAIQEAMSRASVAVLLISADFLTSKFILGEEVPRLLARRDEEGVRVVPLIVRPCVWQAVPWLKRLQARPKDGKPLSAGNENQVDADLAALAAELYDLLQTG